MGKSDRAFLFGLITLLLGLGVPPGFWCTALLSMGIVLSAVTILNRSRLALAEAS
jgi:CDP-diacylglycerol--glycerol-3-phosphate 3-phosphatidyltransferase